MTEKENLFNHNVLLSVRVDGKETGFQPYILSVETTMEFHRLATAEITINDGGLGDDDFPIGDADDFLVGKEVEVLVGKEKADQSIFKGLVEMQSILLESDSSLLKITAKHMAYKMTLERKLRSFENTTDKEVIETICAEYGIKVEVKGQNVKHERLVQYNCTDWDFINLRAEAMGALLYTSPNGIVVTEPDADAQPALSLINGYNLQQLDIEMDARRAFQKHQVDAWNYTTQEIDTAEEADGKGAPAIGNLDTKKLAELNGNETLQSHQMTSQENNDATSVRNKMRATRASCSRIQGTAQVWGYAPLEPSQTVNLEKVGKRFDGKTIVASVTHSIDGSEWLTTIGLGIDDVLYAKRYDDIATQPADGELPPANGLQIAKVEALEGDPLDEERIYISLLGNEGTCLWARLATLDAGNGRGTTFCPEIGDEVVVGFINDHPNQAIVLGMLHSSSAPSPIAKSDDNHQKAIVTREKLQVLFDDEKKLITLSTPGGNLLTLNDDDGGIFLEDQNGNKITMDSNGISIETNKAINIKATQDASIEGNNTTVKANVQLKLQGTSGSELSASGNTVVKGAIVQIN